MDSMLVSRANRRGRPSNANLTTRTQPRVNRPKTPGTFELAHARVGTQSRFAALQDVEHNEMNQQQGDPGLLSPLQQSATSLPRIRTYIPYNRVHQNRGRHLSSKELLPSPLSTSRHLKALGEGSGEPWAEVAPPTALQRNLNIQ